MKQETPITTDKPEKNDRFSGYTSQLRHSWNTSRDTARQHRQRLGSIAWNKIATGFVAIVIAAAAGFGGGLLANNDSDQAALSNSLAGQRQVITTRGQLINQIAKDVGPSVVSVNVTTSGSQNFFGYSPTTEAAGTGIIISKTGVIMTNRHVVPAGVTSVAVTLSDGTQYDNVKVLGRTNTNDSLDIAFLKITDLKGHTLKPAELGDSSTANIGDSVVAIGNALGEFQNSVTAGIISGFGRNVQASSGEGMSAAGTEDLGNLIQTDAAINQGNSGGPLVNINGQVIGVNTAIASGAQNIGFAIPIDDVRGLIEQVLQSGSFKRPFLGVHYMMLNASLAKQYDLSADEGAYIIPEHLSGDAGVLPDTPADRAGLKEGDIITKVNGKAITEDKNLTTLLGAHKPGDLVTLTVVRGDKTISVTITLGTADAQ